MRARAQALACGLLLLAAACRRTVPNEAVESGAPHRNHSTSDVRAPDSSEVVAPSANAAADGAVEDDAPTSKTALRLPVTASLSKDPFGAAKVSTRAGCGAFLGSVSSPDVKTSFVDGDDLLAIANRAPTGQLASDYAPADLVDLQTGKPRSARECERVHCLRQDAAAALGEMLAAMKSAGFPGKVVSAFRSYGVQCGTFSAWAAKSTFCKATEQSALPGHSQHQLGTTIDLFTEAWSRDGRGPFRPGFGCTDGGQYIAERATDFGFVMSYPIHPDDRHLRQSCVTRTDIPVNINPRTGYRYEHWHLRYIGKDAAARFAAARAASAGTPDELTLEQWLRREKGVTGTDAELPVCDGCNCGACSTLQAPGAHACDRKGGAVHLDEHGMPIAGSDAPSIESATEIASRRWVGRVVEVTLDVPKGVLTQPPIVGPDGAGYAAGATYEKLAPYPDTTPRAFPPIADAWVVALEPVPNATGSAWPYRAGISSAAIAQLYNRANVLLPTRGGTTTLRVPIPADVRTVKIVLVRGGVPQGAERVLELE